MGEDAVSQEDQALVTRLHVAHYFNILRPGTEPKTPLEVIRSLTAVTIPDGLEEFSWDHDTRYGFLKFVLTTGGYSLHLNLGDGREINPLFMATIFKPHGHVRILVELSLGANRRDHCYVSTDIDDRLNDSHMKKLLEILSGCLTDELMVRLRAFRNQLPPERYKPFVALIEQLRFSSD